MTLLHALGDWFDDLDLGTPGVDLFLGDRPARPVAAILLDIDSGYAPDVYRPEERPVLRCLVRAETAEEALERADALCDTLDGREQFPLGDRWWCYAVWLQHAPRLLTRTVDGAQAECRFALSLRHGL